MHTVNIKEIRSDQLPAYKAFLAKGLINDEDNFRISPADEALAPFPTAGREDSFTLGAYSNNTLAGIVSFERDGHNREKLRHKGILFRMYVAKEFRGQGIAHALIKALLARVETIRDIEQINLTVIANNNTAKKLYEQYGFTRFASEPNAIKWKGKYFTEDQMALQLKKG